MSAISPGEIVITDPDNQKQNIDDLRRDTTDTNTSLPGIPDLQKLLDEQLKTQQLYDDAAAKAAKMIGDYASERFAEANRNQNTEEMEFWKEGGTGPAILHAIAGGLLGASLTSAECSLAWLAVLCRQNSHRKSTNSSSSLLRMQVSPVQQRTSWSTPSPGPSFRVSAR
ncbi:hypothetical protein HED54_23060 [Ochrobactrum anthropi ATCC 49188]|nr:hypothetical protein [Brucella anthropi ATCC 49188]